MADLSVEGGHYFGCYFKAVTIFITGLLFNYILFDNIQKLNIFMGDIVCK